MNRLLFLLTVTLWLTLPVLAEASSPDAATMRQWVEQFKQSERGPFERIRWFCADGTILPPKPSACSTHGGGVQHGEWNGSAKQIRGQGILLATVLSSVDPSDFIGKAARVNDLRQILLEKFLVRVDDGWVFHRARSAYRGALQIEDEQAAAYAIVIALLDDPNWQTPERFLLLREAVRLLPLDQDEQTTSKIRLMAVELADADASFMPLRVKLHGSPDEGDAHRVRAYAQKSANKVLADKFEVLADLLDKLYRPGSALPALKRLANASRQAQKSALDGVISQLANTKEEDADVRLEQLADLMVKWRMTVEAGKGRSADRLRLLQASLLLEGEVFALANQLSTASGVVRRRQLDQLMAMTRALYGIGLLSQRQMRAFAAESKGLQSHTDPIAINEYLTALRYLARVPQWAQRNLEFQFSSVIALWKPLTPLAGLMTQDRLRESPLLPFTRILDGLTSDAASLAGVSHLVFGKKMDRGIRPLNPGLRRGVLLPSPEPGEKFRPDGIYILPSTTHELPPVAGIITMGEGSSLSHVQLLARNMGIPNVVGEESLINIAVDHFGQRVVMAVSRRGSVTIARDDASWDHAFGREKAEDSLAIAVDLKRLNLEDESLHPLRDIRSDDSGRIVGPKAANLGELAAHYPDRVARGLAIPFGVFRHYLDQPIEPGGPSVFDWMRGEYAAIREIDDGELRETRTAALLSHLRRWITESDPGTAFRAQLKAALAETYGETISGLFVRSDTNVEDLPGFSGAGLNLTLANVVGMDALIEAIKRVWASPFSDRAYSWRQAHMRLPEHVYPAVLLLQSVNSDKSGVMVTADVDSGDRRWLTIVASEGVGGAVDGQSAEELRVNRSSGEVRLLAQASDPLRSNLAAAGGVERVAAAGSESLLAEGEIEQLRALADDVEQYFPSLRREAGAPLAADIEYGFVKGRLVLFQLRPFVENRAAAKNRVLLEMDRQAEAGMRNVQISLDEAQKMEGLVK